MIKAYIEDLKGKYHGTVVVTGDHEVCVWMTTGNPSNRQLEYWGYSREEWNKNEPDRDEYFGHVYPHEMLCDSHYESQEAYDAALALVSHFNLTGSV